jgi:MATE family multidrug resistance protein
VLCGEARGAGERERFVQVVRITLVWGVVSGIAISLAYALIGAPFAASFSTDASVVAATGDYLWWVVLLPLLGVVSFVLDGVFVGAGWTRAMLLTMALAMAIYCAMIFAPSALANDELWLAFSVLFVTRAAGQLAVMPRLIRTSFRQASSS